MPSPGDDSPPMSAPEKADPKIKLRDVPHKPGVYLMRDRFNRVIYVGKARDLRKRVSQYFMPGRTMRADLKTRALLDSDLGFRVAPRRQRARGAAARGPPDQGIPPALQRQLPRRQTLPPGQGGHGATSGRASASRASRRTTTPATSAPSPTPARSGRRSLSCGRSSAC